jgi:signal peptidase II
MTLKKSLLIVFLILVVDQVSKIYIKLNFPLTLYGELPLFDLGWFKLLFIENKGMAWGATINDFIPFISERNGKLFLTLFRMVAVTFIFYWLYNSIKQNANKLLVISLSLILAGAIGNIIDSVFYGYLFTNSYYNIAQFSPGSGYESFFYGHVVDMLQFPMFSWEWPNWIPYFGGESFTFFEPVFNIADSAISIGVGIMLVFNRKIYPENS